VYRYTRRASASPDQTAPSPAPRDPPRSRRKNAAADGSRGADVPAFRRDAPTRLCYAALASFAFWLYAFGPALALLRAELHFSSTLLGVYSAAWSAGSALVGVTFAFIARRLRRAVLLWGSAAAATAGAGLFAAGRGVAPTLLGAGVLGLAGTIMLTCIQAILSDRHGERRDRALTEANIGAAACAVLAPLLLGLLQAAPAGWRVAMSLPFFVLAGLYLRYRDLPLPAAPARRRTGGRHRLPLSCWLLATLASRTASGCARHSPSSQCSSGRSRSCSWPDSGSRGARPARCLPR
jgi:MFS family permease